MVETYRIDEVIIAMPKATGNVVRMVTEACRESGTLSRIVPGVFELLGGNLSVSRLRQVEIADLLRRQPVTAPPGTGMYLAQKRVLVTGAGGSIGCELSRQIALSNPSMLVLVGHGENSIFDVQATLREQFPAVNVQAVIADIRDARGWRLFRENEAADRVSCRGAQARAVDGGEPGRSHHEQCHRHGERRRRVHHASVERLVMISTDKAVSPTSMMGASKRVAEMIVREQARRSGRAFAVVRFGNVLGSRGTSSRSSSARSSWAGPSPSRTRT